MRTQGQRWFATGTFTFPRYRCESNGDEDVEDARQSNAAHHHIRAEFASLPGRMSKEIINRGRCKNSSGGGGSTRASGSNDCDWGKKWLSAPVALVDRQPQTVKMQQSTGGEKQQSMLDEEAMERLHNAVRWSKRNIEVSNNSKVTINPRWWWSNGKHIYKRGKWGFSRFGFPTPGKK